MLKILPNPAYLSIQNLATSNIMIVKKQRISMTIVKLYCK